MPALVGALNVELYECARQLFIFPRRGRLAGPQSHDGVVHADRLPRLQSQIANDAVALVQEAQNSNSVAHWSDTGLLSRSCIRRTDPRAIRLLRLVFAPAPREEQDCCAGYGNASHLSPESRADNRPWPRAGTCPWRASRPGGTRPLFR